MSEIAQHLLPWFDQYGRKDLPWQQQVNGYRVWLSEIMLQQTQVATVIPYFNRFIESFPDVIALADADLDSVLNHWAGLGYYARARNLHKTASIVKDQFNGSFPSDQQQLEALPGIGRSTAGAILSLAFRQKAAILDGNVKRVLARVYQVEGWYGQSPTLKKLWAIAEQQTPDHRVAHYNQAMMDLGATVCKRSKPLCESCALTKICASYQQGTQQQYPVSRPSRTRPHRHCWVVLHQTKGHILMERRPPTGIWGGLWSLPEMEDLAQLDSWQLQHLGQVEKVSEVLEKSLLHKFTHFDLSMSIARVELSGQPAAKMVSESERYQWIDRLQLDQYGLPTPIQKILSLY
jgi:A/G-specific adenine glycosylase